MCSDTCPEELRTSGCCEFGCFSPRLASNARVKICSQKRWSSSPDFSASHESEAPKAAFRNPFADSFPFRDAVDDSEVPVIFSDKLKKAHQKLASRGILTGPIQGDGKTEFFEIRDIEETSSKSARNPDLVWGWISFNRVSLPDILRG